MKTKIQYIKSWGLYECSIILFFIIVPFSATIAEYNTTQNLKDIFFKWLIFSGVGLRLFSAGLKQIITPAFTAKTIFNSSNQDLFVIIKELGFSNIAIASIALLSLYYPTFRLPSAITGSLYFLMAGINHLCKPKDSNEEIFAMISDLYISILLITLIIL